MAFDNNLPTSDYTRNLKAIIALSLILTLISQFIWWKLISDDTAVASVYSWVTANILGLLAFALARQDAPPLIDLCAAATTQMLIVSISALSIGIFACLN